LHRGGVSGGKSLAAHFVDLLLQFADCCFSHFRLIPYHTPQ
jgi:hypothetical protein